MKRNVKHSATKRKRISEIFDWHCAYCGKKKKYLHMDHIIPLSNGGQNIDDNIFPSCGKCNRLKANYSLQQFKLLYFKDKMFYYENKKKEKE